MIKKIEVSRKLEIDSIMEIINNDEYYRENSDNGLVILLNGGWGTGKTKFIEDLEDRIKTEGNMSVLGKYVSWENDFYENPYIPFFAEIEDSKGILIHAEELVNAANQLLGKEILNITYNVGKSILRRRVGVDIDEIVSKTNSITNKISKNKEHLQEYKKFIALKSEVKKDLEKLCEEEKKIFIIDELDRCNPNFAIETLEIMKHFFDINNCIFIISVDKEQLGESVKSIYGEGLDPNLYFSKFFDYQFDLLKISPIDTIEISTISNQNINLVEMKKYVEIIFRKLDISIRDGRKILNLFIKKLDEYDMNFLQAKVTLFLISLRHIDLLGFKLLMDNKFSKYIKDQLDSQNTKFSNYEDILRYNNGELKQFINLTDYNKYNYFKAEAKLEYAKSYSPEQLEYKRKVVEDKWSFQATQALYNYIFIIEDQLTFEEIVYKLTN